MLKPGQLLRHATKSQYFYKILKSPLKSINYFSYRLQKSLLHSYLLGPNYSKENLSKILKLVLEECIEGNGDLLKKTKGMKIAELGCFRGRDFLANYKNLEGYKLYGIDLKDDILKEGYENLEFIKADLEKIPLQDNSIDLGVSSGVLEHIVPIEKLSKVLTEIKRVCKNFIHIVPSISSRYETHTGAYRWQLRSPNDKSHKPNYPLIFLSDEAWLSFEGTQGCQTKRFDLIPGLVTILVIYSTNR